MKKTIFFRYNTLALFMFIILGCTEEEPLVGYPLKQENTVVNIVGTITTPTQVNAEGRDMEVIVSIPQTFASDVKVEVTGTLKSGTQSIATVVIPAGATTNSTTLPIPSDLIDSGVAGISDYFNIELTAILLKNLEAGINYTISSDPINVDLYDSLQWDYGADVIAGRMTYLVDWANPNLNDFDVYVGNLESAESGNRYETDIFDDTHPDGTYTIDAVPYIVTDADIPWRVFIVYPDQVNFEILEGTIVGAVEGEIYPLVEFTKTTDPNTGEVTYSNVTAL